MLQRRFIEPGPELAMDLSAKQDHIRPDFMNAVRHRFAVDLCRIDALRDRQRFAGIVAARAH